MNGEGENDQDGGHSSTIDDLGVLNSTSMQLPNSGDSSALLPRVMLDLSLKAFNRC